jgi:hypothetical protein
VLTSEVWRLDLWKLRWERMPSLTRGRYTHACCTVRGGFDVLGGSVAPEDDESESEEVVDYDTSSVEILGYDGESEESIIKVLPPLSCGPIHSSVAVVIEKSDSELGQVLLIGGWDEDVDASSEVQEVDVSTGACNLLSFLLLSYRGRLRGCSAARLPDWRIVCVGRNDDGGLDGTAQVLEPSGHGSPSEASWQWRYLPAMSVGRWKGGGCVTRGNRTTMYSLTQVNDGELTVFNDDVLRAHICIFKPGATYQFNMSLGGLIVKI